MEPIITTLFVLLFAHSITNVPVVEWKSNQCSSRCQSDPQFVRFDSQKTYEYRLQTKTSFNGQQEVALEAKVEVSAHSPCDLSLQLRQTRLQGLDPQEALLLQQQLEEQPIQFGYDDGVITDVCAEQEDHLWAIDVKKAVISALQMSSRSLHERQTLMESDILGDCQTTYQPMSRRYATAVLRKTKSLNNCANRQLANIGLFPRAFSASSYQNLPFMNATFECLQTVDKDLIVGATCQETQQLRGYGTQVSSQLNLRFDGQTSGLSTRRVRTFLENNRHLLMSSRFDSKEDNNQDLNSILRTVCQHLESDSNEKTVESFPQLVKAFNQNQNQQQIQRSWKSVQNQEICSSKQLSDLFLDASALSGSPSGAQVLFDAYQTAIISKERSNYLFSLLAFTSSPTEKAVQILQPLLKSADTPKHVILGISGLIHNLKHSNGREGQSERAIDALLERMSQQKKDSSIVATIKAIENIGVESHQKARQQLMKVSQDSRQSNGVRSAAIKALSEGMDSKQRQEMIEIFAKENESNEIRINAYKAVVMSGADNKQLQQIKDQIRRERNRDVQQYVRSHQKNLRESSDPHKKDVLPKNAPQFEEPSNQWMGISNNFESSFMFDALSLGMAFGADVINPKESSIPRSMTANITIPAFGRELQLIEVEIRQKGFESQIKQKMRQLKNKSGQSLFKQMMAEAIDIISSSSEWTSNSVDSRDLQMQVYVKVDGKTILSVDSSDAKQDWEQMWNQLRQKLDQRLDIDRAFAVQPINTRIQLPTSNGLPIVVRLNATLVSSLKTSLKVSDFQRNSNSKQVEAMIAPSFALQVEAGVEFMAKNQRKAIEVVSRVSSSPVWDSKAEIRENRILNVKINLPKERQSLVRVETQVFERDSRGMRVNKNNNNYGRNSGYKTCTQTLKKAFGLQFCAEMSSHPLAYELSLEKSERTMKSFEFSVESPEREGREIQNYRIAFNTPNSELDREMSAELRIENPKNGKKSAKLEVRSPWIRYSFEGGLTNEDKEQSFQLEVQKEGRKQLSLDLGLESQQRGQKREYKPRIRIQVKEAEPVQMQGSVSVSKGRKNQLQIQLEGNQKQFLKGSFVREGERKSSDIRVSTDLSANLPQIELRVVGVAEKGVKHAETDLTIEYRIAKQRKESLKVSWKVQNLTQSQLTKVSAFGELTSTQWPGANFHLAYNLLAKPQQQMENELTLAWTQQLSSKIHILHVTKLSEQSANEHKLENTLNLEVTPLNLNYELRANAEVQKKSDSSSGPKYTAEVIGKDRTGRKENDIKANFAYKHISQSPLHLTLEANLKTQKRDIQYRDELRERAQGEYQGQTSFQWQKGQKADLDYNYKVKGQLHHEMDAQLKVGDKHMIKHSGMLKMSPNVFQVKSKLSQNDNHIYNLDSYLSRESPSQVEAHSFGYAVKASADPYSVPQLASVELWTPNARINAFQHKTNVEFIPRVSFALKSDTKRNSRNVLNLETHISRTEPSRIVVNSEPIEGRLDCDLLSSAGRRSANLALKSQSQDWSHSSSLAFEPKESFEMKSKTVSKGKPIFQIDSNWKPRQQSFLNIEVPQQKTTLAVNGVLSGRQKSGQLELLLNDLKHKTDFELNSNQMKIQSKTDSNRRQIHSLNYNHNNGLHSLDSELFQDYRISGEAQRFGEEPYLHLNGQKKSSQFETQAKISRQDNKISFESKTKQFGNDLNSMSAHLSSSPQEENQFSYISPQIRAKVIAIPAKRGQLEWECPQVSHQTNGQWNGQQEDYSLDSKTFLKNRNQFLNFAVKHSPLRMSRISALIPIGDAQFELTNQRKARFAANSKHPNYPYSHVTEVSADPNQWNLESRTDSQSENVFSVNSKIQRNGENPSALEMRIGKQFSLKGRALPFRQLVVEAKHPNYSHVTNLDLDANSLQLKSRTENSFGKNLAKIDAFLTPRDELRSHVTFVAHNSNGNFEFEPKKSAKFELNANQYNHKTEISRNVNNNEIRIQSKTTRGGANVLDVNSRLNDWQKSSHLNLNSPIVETQFETNPSQRTAKISFKTQTVNHESEVNGLQRAFNSQTQRNGRLWARINGKLEDNNQLEVEIPAFVAKSNLNFGQRSAQMDFRSKIPSGRHLLASVAFNNGFHSDIAWDSEKDPNQRLIVDISVEREGSTWSAKQVVYSLSGSYAGNEAKLVTRMTSSQVLRGPHEIQVNYVPKFNPKKESLSASFKHEINSKDQMLCQLDYSEGQRQRFGAKFNAQLEEEGLSANLETVAPNNADLEMKVTFNERHSRNKEISFDLKALKTTLNEEYSLSAKIEKLSSLEFKGSARMECPQNGPQDLEFVLQNNELRVWTQNTSGKQLQFNANYKNSGQNGHEAQIELKSNMRAIPSFSVNGVLNEEEVLLTLDLEAQRKVDFLVKKSGNSYSQGMQITGRLETSLFPKIETKNSLKYNSREIQFQSNVKYDFKDISSVELDAKKESGVWAGNARIAANGAELAKASIESTFGSNTMSYILNAKTRDWSPIKVHFSSEKISSSERKVQINACSQQNQCFDLKTQFKRNSNQLIPEKTFFSFSKIGTNIEIKTSFMEQMETKGDSSSVSLLGVTTNERIKEKTRNQFQISINSHKLGFDEISQHRSHGYDASIRVNFPSNRVIQIKTDFADRKTGSSSERDVISKTQLFFEESNNPLIETEIHLQSNEKRVSANIQLSSEKFQRSPKVFQMEVQRDSDGNQKPFSGKLFLDLSSNPNEALTIESQVIQRSMNSQWNSREKNSTLSLNVWTKDKKSIDFQMSSHVSPISAGINYRNRNRRGQQKFGSVLVKRETNNGNNGNYGKEEKRFNVELKDENNDYSVDASFSGGKQIQMKVRDERSGQQSDLILGLDDKCAKVELKSGQSGDRKRFDFCLNFDNRNDKIASLSLETNNEKTAELTLEVDSRDQKSLKASLQWNPKEVEEWQKEWKSGSQYSSSSYSFFFNELMEELSQKSEVVAKQLQSEALLPLMDQANDVIQEIYSQFKSLQFVERLVDSIASSLNKSSDWLSNGFHSIWQKVMRSARKQCKRSEMCFKTIYALQNYGFDSAGDLVFESLKRTHRLVVTSSGRLYASLPSLPDWVHVFVDDYRQSISNAFQTIIDSNSDLREVANHVTTVFEEVKKNTEEVDWNQIQKAFNQIKEILFSAQTSSRVVVWDPQRGKASLEIRSPAIQSRRLRAVLQNVTEEIQKKDSIKSMFF